MRRCLPLFTLMLFVSCQPGQGSKSITLGNIIQDGDDRTNVSKLDDKSRKTAAAIATIVEAAQIIDNKDGTFTIKPKSIDSDLCPEEKFSNSYSYGSCTAFKIADNAIGTAAHCIESQKKLADFCTDNRFIFDFNDAGTKPGANAGDRIVNASQIATCDSVGYYSHSSSGDDFAVLFAETNPEIPSLDISDRELKVKDKVIKIAHGYGYLSNMSVGKVTNINEKYEFESTNDIFGGDSGAPILDAETHEVVGVAVRAYKAHAQFRVFDAVRTCYLEPKTKDTKTGLVVSKKASTIVVPALQSLLKYELVNNAIKNPTLANLENLKKEVDPNLHFSLTNGEVGVSFLSGLFQIHKYSVPLLKELSPILTEESYLTLLTLGVMNSQKFAVAVYDRFSDLIEYNDLDTAANILHLVPDSRLEQHLSHYEDDQLIDLSLSLYKMRSPLITKVVAHKRAVVGYMKKDFYDRTVTLWAELAQNYNSLMKGLDKTDKDEITRLNLDYSILCTYFGVNKELTPDDLKIISRDGTAIGKYMKLLIEWNEHQKKPKA
ncbi:trypsin-like serine peptidase [Peredibacter sp. HCB2-198]|uniref:trypsin-like serine peptidase n=1 Tax=Peredibacter sp. HCB2-198 TaxID=3383025 RepID=UPI0038B5D5CC